LRVLHLVDRWTDRGGAYWHLRGVLEHQERGERRHEVFLAAGLDDGTMDRRTDALIPALNARIRETTEVERLVADVRPDVLHLHNVVNPEALERVARRDGVVRVVTMQDHRFFCPARGKWTAEGKPCRDAMSKDVCASCFSDEAYFEDIYALTAARSSTLLRFRVVALSRYMRSELVAVGVPEEQIRVVPPFVHGLDREASPDGERCVLFAGRLAESKGIRDAVHAWRLSGVDLPLVVAGSGPLRSELQGPGIEWLGWVRHEKMASLYRRAACLVFPSRWQEPFGIAGLEALTMGTPVAAWESGGVAEWHPGPLAPWGDREALANRIRSESGRRARPPSGFDAKELMRRLDEVYD
jgi:glycosyltransferase involved in cell wall biosynthesis